MRGVDASFAVTTHPPVFVQSVMKALPVVAFPLERHYMWEVANLRECAGPVKYDSD